MTILVDADACPVIAEIIELADNHQLNVILVRNFNHYTSKHYPDFVSVQYVDDGADSADYKIVALTRPGDIVITQDYGLASLLLNKKAIILHHNGKLYTKDNIDQLLTIRHTSLQMRRAGIRTKGPKALSPADKAYFKEQLEKTILNQ
ncbi:YaiI/YqxD family protein [Macrococcus brunensis]|uniref:YaiI/YqxD family protein n=1 Tax=Macrococcus brunensis TaxID=198483 RepID=UPI001EEFDBAD|nr:YaiI/YqxD family protein [Macrococcus brunensis]ULG72479.1 YaiI/YqxD family protein [Macrococcus brunensis]